MVNCCKCIKMLLKKCNIFGILITFRINNEIEYRSIYGGIGTIIFFIFSIGCTICLGYPFIRLQTIDFIYSNKIIETQPYINLTEAHFNFAFGIQYQNNTLQQLMIVKNILIIQ